MKVTIAHPYTSKAGGKFAPGDHADLPEGEARLLVDAGRASVPPAEPAAPMQPVSAQRVADRLAPAAPSPQAAPTSKEL